MRSRTQEPRQTLSSCYGHTVTRPVIRRLQGRWEWVNDYVVRREHCSMSGNREAILELNQKATSVAPTLPWAQG